jgi:hypothetical protein
MLEKAFLGAKLLFVVMAFVLVVSVVAVWSLVRRPRGIDRT